MSNPENSGYPDITPDDNGLSPEARQERRTVMGPRGEEGLKDAINAEIEAEEKEIAELQKALQEMSSKEDPNPYMESLTPRERDIVQEVARQVNDMEVEPSSPNKVANTMRNHPIARKVVSGILITLASSFFASGLTYLAVGDKRGSSNNTAPVESAIQFDVPVERPEVAVPEIEESTDTGETNEAVEDTQFEKNEYGTMFSYEEYRDFKNKECEVAFGYNYADHFNDREKTSADMLKMAKKEPEALASYAYYLLTDQEKAEYGIKGLNMIEIDHKFDQEGGGDLQQKLLGAIDQILNDQENTKFEFYLENDTERTNYILFIDKNKDGKADPREMELRYANVKRNNAPQFDVKRYIDEKWQKSLDANMLCGMQPNSETAPEGVHEIELKGDTITGGGPIIPPETKPQTEPETKPQTEPETKPQTEPETKPQTEPQTQPQTEPQTQPQTEPQTQPQTEPQTQPQTQPQTDKPKDPKETEDIDEEITDPGVNPGESDVDPDKPTDQPDTPNSPPTDNPVVPHEPENPNNPPEEVKPNNPGNVLDEDKKGKDEGGNQEGQDESDKEEQKPVVEKEDIEKFMEELKEETKRNR